MPEAFIVQAEATDLPQAWDWVEKIGDHFRLSHETIFAIHICVEEALANIIEHGFPAQRDTVAVDKTVHLNLTLAADAVVLTVEDRGVTFDPLQFSLPPTPASLSDAPIGGRGIRMMRAFSKDMAYERRDGANHLTFRFRLGSAGP